MKRQREVGSEGAASSSYRDRAAERRQQESGDGANGPGRPKGLDFGLLELQRKGIRVGDEASDDVARIAQYKLLEQHIGRLYPAPKSFMGWQMDVKLHSASIPVKLVDQDSNKEEGERSRVVLSVRDVETAREALKNSLSHESEASMTKTRHQGGSISEDEDNDRYAREVQELSDEEEELGHLRVVHKQRDDAPPVGSTVFSQTSQHQEEDGEDDDFDMFGNPSSGSNGIQHPISFTEGHSNATRPSLSSKHFLELTVPELRSMLQRIEEAIRVREILSV